MALAIRIANGYSSTFAAEVGDGVMEYYYGITDPDELITGTANDMQIEYLDKILSGLKYEDGNYNLVSLKDPAYQQCLDNQIEY